MASPEIVGVGVAEFRIGPSQIVIFSTLGERLMYTISDGARRELPGPVETIDGAISRLVDRPDDLPFELRLFAPTKYGGDASYADDLMQAIAGHMCDLFGEPVSPEQVANHLARKAAQQLEEEGLSGVNLMKTMYQNFLPEQAEYGLFESSTMRPSNFPSTLTNETWSEYAMREAGLESPLVAADRIQPQ